MNYGTHYDQTSVEQAKKKRGGVGVPLKELKRFHSKHLGDDVVVVSASGSVTLGPFSEKRRRGGRAAEAQGRRGRQAQAVVRGLRVDRRHVVGVGAG